MDNRLEYIDRFKNRSSLRKYSAIRQVDDATLRQLVEAASHAPTTGNMQLYSVVATRDPGRKARLATLHFNQPAATGCSVMLTVCADLRRFEKWCELRDAKPGFRNFHSFVTALIDASLFAQQLVTIAELNGIGSCYLGTVTYNATDIAKELGLPDRVVPVACLTMGYPDDETGFPAPSDRLSVEAVLHSEVYHEPTPEEIDRFYAEKEALPESERFVEENGKTSLAQVFTDVRYPRSMNEEVSDSFSGLLKEKGFQK